MLPGGEAFHHLACCDPAETSRTVRIFVRFAHSTAEMRIFGGSPVPRVRPASCRIGPNRPDKAWTHLYRALQRGDAKNACAAVQNLAFPSSIVACAATFVRLQEERHDADYNPDRRVLRAHAVAAIDRAEKAIEDLSAAARRDRKALAVHLLHKKRR
jgi:hypothetical protein